MSKISKQREQDIADIVSGRKTVDQVVDERNNPHHYIGVNTSDIQKAADDAVNGDNDALVRYYKLEKEAKVQSKRDASRELDEITETFEAIIRKDIRKSNETSEQQQRRLWAANSDLEEAYSRASRAILM